MPAITWPADVPNCFLLNSYVEERQPVTIRSPVDSGPQKIRRRYTRPLVGIVAAIVCDRDELANLWRFFDIELQGGVLQFENENPVSKTTENYRFLQPPRFTPLSDENFNVEIVLEQL